MNQNTICDANLVDLFLVDQLGDDEQAAFEQHLESCSSCRQQLEERAAGADRWSEVREFLSSDDDAALQESSGMEADGHEVATTTDAVLRMLAPTDDPRMLGRLGGYEIAGVVGRGGMGVVLKGFDAALNRYVAIKVLAPHLATSAAARRRFSREAQAAAAVVHDNVIAIHGVAEAGGLPYLVMPYVRGVSLQKRLNDHGPLGVAEILRIGMQTAAGLAAAHAQGLVHRDIKPANILLEDGVERLKITDFGLARAADDASLTRTGVIAGTPQFMSPEQARGETVDARSDLFSLGSVLYALCTGRPPFRAETSFGVLRRISDSQARPIVQLNPDIPAWLCTIIERLHAKDASGRFQSAAEVALLLEQCLAHVQQPDSVPLPDAVQPRVESKEPPRRASPVRTLALAAAAIAICAAVIVTAALMMGRNSGGDGEPPSRRQVEAAASDGPATRPGGSLGAQANWDDGVAGELQRLGDNVEQLERDSQRLWDTFSPSLAPTDSPKNDPSIEQEHLP